MDFQNPIIVQILLAIVSFLSAVITSSGFWLFVIKRSDKKSASNRLLMGLAHDRIIYLGMNYISKSWISRDEYENLHSYLYDPYKEMGGNGSATRVMCEIDKLPIRENNYKSEEQKKRDTRNQAARDAREGEHEDNG